MLPIYQSDPCTACTAPLFIAICSYRAGRTARLPCTTCCRVNRSSRWIHLRPIFCPCRGHWCARSSLPRPMRAARRSFTIWGVARASPWPKCTLLRARATCWTPMALQAQQTSPRLQWTVTTAVILGVLLRRVLRSTHDSAPYLQQEMHLAVCTSGDCPQRSLRVWRTRQGCWRIWARRSRTVMRRRRPRPRPRRGPLKSPRPSQRPRPKQGAQKIKNGPKLSPRRVTVAGGAEGAEEEEEEAGTRPENRTD